MENLGFGILLPSDETWQEVEAAWQALENEECQKNNAMTTPQIFDYIEHVISDREPIEDKYVSYLGSTEMLDEDGWAAAHYFGFTIVNVLESLARRLEGELSGLDIKNLKEVMVGDISLADHTALFCVHRHMIRTSKTRMPIIRQYLSRLQSFIVDIVSSFTSFDAWHEEDCDLREMEREEEQKNMAINNRPQRRRKAPERLNITSCKGKSYQ